MPPPPRSVTAGLQVISCRRLLPAGWLFISDKDAAGAFLRYEWVQQEPRPPATPWGVTCVDAVGSGMSWMNNGVFWLGKNE